MASVSKETSISEYQGFTEEVYGLPNDRHFGIWDMLSNVQRFTMRGMKGIRKGDDERTVYNLLIAMSWFVSTLNRLHIDLEEAVWKRFPYKCSYCGSAPCQCSEKKPEQRKELSPDESMRPSTLKGYQEMFEDIYPSKERTLEHAGIHLAEEIGEISEVILAYKGGHEDSRFSHLIDESADFFSCLIGVSNSLDVDVAQELSQMFDENCHVCHDAPCTCTFSFITNFES